MRESMFFSRENVIFTSCSLSLNAGADIWHHVAYVNSTYSCLWQQFNLTLLGSRYTIAMSMPTHYKAILC